MSVTFNDSTSKINQMPGGGPQGTLLGVLEYLVECNDNADCVNTDCRFMFTIKLYLNFSIYPTFQLEYPHTTISCMLHQILVLIIFLSLRPTFTALRYALTQYLQTGPNRIKWCLIVRNPTLCYSPDLHPTLLPDWN